MTDNASADVLIIGAGASGLMAAVQTAEAGLSTMIIESQPQIGGTSRLSGGYVALCETDLEPGGRDELYADLTNSHHNDCDLDLNRLYAEEAAATYQCLLQSGLTFRRTAQFAHMSRPWAHELGDAELTGGAEIVHRLASRATTAGATLHLSRRARRLTTGPGGEIDGVLCEDGAGPQRFAARRATILACGGFTRNRAMTKNFGRPGAENIIPLTGPSSHGDGLLMAMKLGADTSYMTLGVAPTAAADPLTGIAVQTFLAGAVLLNRHGERFISESNAYTDISWAGLEQPDGLMVQIYDQTIQDLHRSTMAGRTMIGYEERESATLEALLLRLADECGLNAAAALATIQRYNDDATKGCDRAFGRRHLVGTSGDITPIVTPPFYGVPTRPGTTHFNGGLKVDAQMGVLDVFGERIPGLFAAGEITGGFHGAGYMSATSMGMALVFGRIAGRSAAADRRGGEPRSGR